MDENSLAKGRSRQSCFYLLFIDLLLVIRVKTYKYRANLVHTLHIKAGKHKDSHNSWTRNLTGITYVQMKIRCRHSLAVPCYIFDSSSCSLSCGSTQKKAVQERSPAVPFIKLIITRYFIVTLITSMCVSTLYISAWLGVGRTSPPHALTHVSLPPSQP